MPRSLLTLLALLTPLAIPATLPAEEAPSPVAAPVTAKDDPAATNLAGAVTRLFAAEAPEAAWFSEAFLATVPLPEIVRIVRDLTDRFGPLRAVTAEGEHITVQLESADVPARADLDAQGRFTTLWLGPPVPVGEIDDHAAAIASLPGETALVVLTDGEERAAHRADMPIAVASSAKLLILQAVAAAVADGRLAWDEVVALAPGWRSLPTGVLQDWPPGTPVTIATLAALMISISDNTATDALLDLVGREAVEALTPRNTPFPSTRELFLLKAEGAEAQRRAWIEGDAEARRALIAAMSDLPPPDRLAETPTPEIEWHLTARELCHALDAVADLPAIAIAPGVARPEDWRSIAFKGGSEPGVLALATRLETEAGAAHCVVAAWNDTAPLDEARLIEPYRGILRALAAPGGS